LCDDILTSNEKSLRDSIKWTNRNNRLVLKESYKEIADSTEEFLVKGVTVLCHTPSGSINESTLSYNSEKRRLEIKKTGGFFKFAARVRGVNISDIFSLRPGTHSYGFVQSKSQNKKQENVSAPTFHSIHFTSAIKVFYIPPLCCLSLLLFFYGAVHVHHWFRMHN
jgi:hypothetical protein